MDALTVVNELNNSGPHQLGVTGFPPVGLGG
jgi:hypothetical protein